MNTNFEDNKTISDEEEEMKKGKNPKIAPQMAPDDQESYHDNYGVIQHMDQGGMAQWVPGTPQYDAAVQSNNGTDPYSAKMQALAKMLQSSSPQQTTPVNDSLSVPATPPPMTGSASIPLLPAQGIPQQRGQIQNYPSQQYKMDDTDTSNNGPNQYQQAKQAALQQIMNKQTPDHDVEDIDLSGYKDIPRTPVKKKKEDDDD